MRKGVSQGAERMYFLKGRLVHSCLGFLYARLLTHSYCSDRFRALKAISFLPPVENQRGRYEHQD